MKKFTKISAIAIVLALSCYSLNAQDLTTNLFKYGSPIVSSEDNLKNLIRNFPLYIENADIIDLLSYNYVDIIKNKKQSKRYVKNNFNRKMPTWGNSNSYESNSNSLGKSTIRLLIDENQNYYDFKEIVNTISDKYVHVGYEVYMLTFVFKLKAYDYYIFINPETKHVVTKGNLFGFNISEEHFKTNAVAQNKWYNPNARK
jgi:hypothetical protein